MRCFVLAMLLVQEPTEDAVVFFSMKSAEEALPLVKRYPQARVVLLVEDFGELEKHFAKTEVMELVRTLGKEIPIWDVEGLDLAKRLGISELPALAVYRGGKWHVAAGSKAEVRCK